MANILQFQMHFLERKCFILIQISFMFIPKDLIVNKSALVQVIVWCLTANWPLT